MNKLGRPLKIGKVCDIYDAGEYLIMDRTDRFSVDDANLPGEIQYKGLILNQITTGWMKMTEGIVKNHLVATDAKTLLMLGASPDQMGRVAAVKKCTSLPFECIVRGYYIPKSHSWDEYKLYGTICGVPVKRGLEQSEKLPEAVFTPSTKEEGTHDVNISFEKMQEIMEDFIYSLFSEIYPEVDDEEPSQENDSEVVEEMTFEEYCHDFAFSLCEKMRDISLKLYNFAHDYAIGRGIIVADTKLEFGLDENLELILIDEAFTPDSSRFWNAGTYKVGKDQPSMDKQYLRDYVHNTLNWHGLSDGPAPKVPDYVKNNVSQIYCDIYYQLFGISIYKLTEDIAYEWHEAEKELGII